MIRVNLLPRTVAVRAAGGNVRNQLIAAGVVVALSLVGIFIIPNFGYFPITNKIKQLDAEIKKADEELKKVQEAQKLLAQIKENTRKIEEKLNIIKDIEKKRTGPVWLMDEMTDAVSKFCVTNQNTKRDEWKYLDNKVFLQKFSVSGNALDIEGMALNNTYLVAFLNNLKFKSHLFHNVVLYYSDQTSYNAAVVRKFRITANIKLTARPGVVAYADMPAEKFRCSPPQETTPPTLAQPQPGQPGQPQPGQPQPGQPQP